MKNLIITFIAFVAIISSCNDSKSSKKEISTKFENVSWEFERSKKYQLVRPIDYKDGGVDVYGLPIHKGQWYLISAHTDCYLLPVYTGGGGPGFIENCITWNKIATIDTMFANSMSSTKVFNGLSIAGRVRTMEILCFIKGYSVEPSVGMYGMGVFARKEK